MKTVMRFKHIDSDSRAIAREFVEKLGKQMLDGESAAIPPDTILRATLNKDARRDGYRASLRLSFGGRILIARERDDDLIVALERAAESLDWRIHRYVKHRTQRIREKKAPQPWQELEKALQQQLAETRRDFADILLPQIAGLTHFVARERAYLQAEDRLAHDYPSTEEILDEVLVRALESPTADREILEVTGWIHQLAIEVIAAHVDEHHANQVESISLEGSAVTSAAVDADLIDDGWLDEELRLFELMPTTPDEKPFELVNRAEAQRQALTLARTLPMRWRRIISLHYFDELPIETIAETLRMPRDEVRAIADAALDFLRERLLDQGIDVLDAGWPADYVVAPPKSKESQRVIDELSALVSLAWSAPAHMIPTGDRE